eukprot:GHUV01027728.1.p2 GENE.GHUV01027728.1~~GHUV01027728.1.p2  ORF type:complete len:151 (+),score=20.08 GHUV01027728.1:569-1021(+)
MNFKCTQSVQHASSMSCSSRPFNMYSSNRHQKPNAGQTGGLCHLHSIRSWSKFAALKHLIMLHVCCLFNNSVTTPLLVHCTTVSYQYKSFTQPSYAFSIENICANICQDASTSLMYPVDKTPSGRNTFSTCIKNNLSRITNQTTSLRIIQ